MLRESFHETEEYIGGFFFFLFPFYLTFTLCSQDGVNCLQSIFLLITIKFFGQNTKLATKNSENKQYQVD